MNCHGVVDVFWLVLGSRWVGIVCEPTAGFVLG